jgi:HEAT repeat protein
MSDDPVSTAKQTEPGSPITVGDIVNSVGVAIGPNASVTIVAGPPPLSPEESVRLLTEYRARVLEETRYVNLRGIPLPRGRDGRPMPLQVPLDKVYIRIQATTEKQHRAQEEAEQRSLSDRSRGGSSTSRDVLSTLHTLGEYFYRRGEVYEAEQRPEPVDPQEALKNHKRLVVLGAPGAGKSTLLRYLARRAAEDTSGFVPIQVSLRDYATAMAGDNTLALSEFALRMASAGNSELRQALENEIKSEHILWLVDALDEARGWATEAARQAGKLLGQLILTSRPVGYVSTGSESLPHFEVLPLTPKNVDEFLQNWFDLLATQRAASDEWTAARVTWLKRQLETRPHIRTLTRNPLLLTFLVILAGEDPLHDLPDQRAEIYRRYIEELLDSWETERRPKSGAEGKSVFTLGSLQGDQARQMALQGFYYLGWALHLAYYGGKPQEPPTRDTLIKTLAEYLQVDGKKDAKFLAPAILEFWQEAGLLETWRLDGDEYLSFRHLTFQEYAASWGIAGAWKRNSKHAWKFLRPRLHHYAWHEPLLLLVGLMEPTHLNDLANRLLRGPSAYEASLHRDLRLVGEILAEGASLAYEKSILDSLGQFRNHVWMSTIVFDLYERIGLHSIPHLGLVSTDAGVRASAARSLGKIGDAEAIPYLLQALQDSDYGVRLNAAEALGQIGDAQAVTDLLRALQDSDNNMRRAAATALGRIGDAQAVPGLLQALQDWDNDMHSIAAEALGQIGPPAIPGLILALQDKYSFMRFNAALAHSSGNDYYSQESRIILWHSREFRRMSEIMDIAKAFGQIGPRAISVLTQALHDSDSGVRCGAAAALGQIGDTQTVSGLLRALLDKDSDVCGNAASALGQIGDARAVPSLLQAMRHRDSGVRCDAASALGQIGDAQAMPILLQTLQDSDNNVRWSAARALEQIGDAQAVPGLLQALLQDSDNNVRCTAAEALSSKPCCRIATTMCVALPLKPSNRSVMREPCPVSSKPCRIATTMCAALPLKPSNRSVMREPCPVSSKPCCRIATTMCVALPLKPSNRSATCEPYPLFSKPCPVSSEPCRIATTMCAARPLGLSGRLAMRRPFQVFLKLCMIEITMCAMRRLGH